jgi:hypothetical protein
MLGIEDFYALLTSGEGEENVLLAALRKLTEITQVKQVEDPVEPNAPKWW